MTLSIKMEKKHGFFKQKKIWNSTGTATCPRTSTVKTSLNITSEVLINVGLFESNEKGDIFPKRNSRIPAKAGKKYTVDEVLKTTLKKHSDSDQLFWTSGDYVLCYPDQKVVEFIPGTTESFTVEKYKEELLSKHCSKMDLFLCNISVCGNSSNIKNSKSNARIRTQWEWAIRMRRKKKMIYWIIIDRHLNLELLVPLDYHQETSFLVALLVLLVYQILRSPGFLDLFHKLAY